MREEMRRVARVSEETPQAIVTRCLQHLPVHSANSLPPLSTIKRTSRNNKLAAITHVGDGMSTVSGNEFVRFECIMFVLIAADQDL